MQVKSSSTNTEQLSFNQFKKEVLDDYKIAVISRECSLLGRREVLTGKAKFGIFGDGKEVPQLAMAKAFKKGDFTPTIDGNHNLGTPIKRFRDINTISGTSTVWTSTSSVITPNLDLGLDSLSNPRIITANNSIIQNDILNGGQF